ncbi:thiamine diphosphokinase [Calorimonas adulescens]|uniref:Thiamine diphosphokinase n=1 Tax=Calorimonas adulescens TaxID=2606906 RepID=A0A5D8QGW1_9THEO|nr:thiamine diphosphokinase [Calorimonas adulescens]TZE83404.1 thiamine diphosphokinase [Calorimonas adulescens]
MKAVILSNGNVENIEFLRSYIESSDIFICADGGGNYAKSLGIKPDILIGDFDSIKEEILNYFQHLGTEIIRYPREKNYVDTQLAVDRAIELSADKIILLGATGNRLDHTLANINMLYYIYKKGVTAEIVDEHNRLMLLKGENFLRGQMGDTVSFIPFFGDVKKIVLKGFYYPLDGVTLTKDTSLGISNVFTEDVGYVDSGDDFVLAIFSYGQ